MDCKSIALHRLRKKKKINAHEVFSVAVQVFSVATIQVVVNPRYELEFWHSSQHSF